MTVLTLDPTPAPRALGDGTTRGAASSADNDAPQPYAITTIAWAPSCGRSYHLVATGGRDGHVRIWRVKPPALEDDGETDGTEGPDAQWSAAVVADFDDHKWVPPSFHIREMRSLADLLLLLCAGPPSGASSGTSRGAWSLIGRQMGQGTY